MKKYCLGFIFSNCLNRVALVRKLRPEWQAGFLNGVGGHVEGDESPLEAMSRETWEEAGVRVPVSAWRAVVILNFGTVGAPEGPVEMHVYTARVPAQQPLPILGAVESDELVAWFDIESLVYGRDTIPNLAWLIPLCLSQEVLDRVRVVSSMNPAYTKLNNRRPLQLGQMA